MAFEVEPFSEKIRSGGRDFGGGGEGGGLPPNFIFPVAPRDVKVVVSHVGARPSLMITWTDETVTLPAKATVHHWQVRYAEEKIVGTISNETNFPLRVLGLSRFLNTVTSSGRGEPLSLTHTQEGLKDGYVIIVGSTEFGIAGPPSEPWLVRVESSSKTLSPDVTEIAAVTYIETYKGSEYVNFTPTFRAPEDIFFFRGIQVYWTPYVIDALAEMGNMDVYTWSTPAELQTSPYRRFPLSDNISLGRGTAAATSGDPNLVRLSGTAFDPAWVGRPIFINDRDPVTNQDILEGGWVRRSVLTVTDVDNMAMDGAANFTSTVSFFILRNITAYFVALAIYGRRRLDITGAPSITL